MAGFGTMPYGSGPYGLQSVTPSSPSTSRIASSRRFDANGKLVQRSDGSGDAEGMNDSIQRALFLLALLPRPTFIGADFASDTEAEIRQALHLLTEQERVLAIDSIVAIDNGDASTLTQVTIRDLVDGRTHVWER